MNWRTGLIALGVVLVLTGVGTLTRTGCAEPHVGLGEVESDRTGSGPESAGYAGQPTEENQNRGAWSVLSGLLIAAGAGAIGVGLGRWGRQRPPRSRADYTGSE